MRSPATWSEPIGTTASLSTPESRLPSCTASTISARMGMAPGPLSPVTHRIRVTAVELQVSRLEDEAMLPTRAHEGDAGLDLYACEAAHIGPGERWSVGTGIAVEIPDGHAGLVLPRSGLARDHGISLPNSPGLIDSGYRGEIRVLLLNTDPAETFTLSLATGSLSW